MKATIIFLNHSAKAEHLCSELVTHTNHINGDGHITHEYLVDADKGCGRATFTIECIDSPDDENADAWTDVFTMNTEIWGGILQTEVWLDDVTA